jgi:hypothetical protein
MRFYSCFIDGDLEKCQSAETGLKEMHSEAKGKLLAILLIWSLLVVQPHSCLDSHEAFPCPFNKFVFL